jgi:hypothetical protein
MTSQEYTELLRVSVLIIFERHSTLRAPGMYLESFLLSFRYSERVSLQARLFENRFPKGPLTCVKLPTATIRKKILKPLTEMRFFRPLPIWYDMHVLNADRN